MSIKFPKGVFVILVTTVLLSAALTSYAYSMWYAKLGLDVFVKSGNLDVNFKCCKLIHCCCCYCSHHHRYRSNCWVSPDGSSINVNLDNIYPGWSGWLVMLLKNEGSLPAKLGDNGVSVVTGGELGKYMRVVRMYVFGPFKGTSLSLWKKIDVNNIRIPYLSKFPLVLDPGEGIIILIKLHLSRNAPYGASGTLSIRVNAEPYNG